MKKRTDPEVADPLIETIQETRKNDGHSQSPKTIKSMADSFKEDHNAREES